MSGNNERIKWFGGYTPTSEEEQQIIAEARKASEKAPISPAPPIKWEDAPPILDWEGLITEALLEDAHDNANEAKVGDTYLEYAYNIRALAPVEFDAKKPIPVPYTEKRTTRDTQVDTEEPLEKVVTRGYKVWIVLQLQWTKEDERKQQEAHMKYAAYYPKRKTDYRMFFEKTVKIWPRDKLPNGLYWSERWQPKVWDEERKEWLPASEKDCLDWASIPLDKKRIDYLYGVLPDE